MKDSASVRLTARQFEILRGELGAGSLEMAKKLDKTTDAAEKEYYRNTMAEFEVLERVLREADPRTHDTSQDVDEDEDDAEWGDDEDGGDED